jgi:hypothetical protein
MYCQQKFSSLWKVTMESNVFEGIKSFVKPIDLKKSFDNL